MRHGGEQRNMGTPQDPYHSWIVSAAAGSGKTWQLSRRFLFLVGAHAAPSEILTVTFTRKAAAEMRARVIACAAELAVDKQAQREFDRALSDYHKNFSSQANQPVRPPLAAPQVSSTILSQSQKLNIATIHSVCSGWLSSLAGQGFAGIPLPFKIITDAEETDVQERSWQRLWQTLPACAQQTVREEGVASVRRNIGVLHNFGLPQPRRQALNLPAAPSWAVLARQLAALPGFASCAAATTQAELQQIGVLKGKKINRALLTAAQKKQLQPRLQALEAELQAQRQADLVVHLNARGKTYFSLWQRWREIYRELKKTRRVLDFQDLTTMVRELLTRDAGLLFFLQQRIAHLLLDEFQDTSEQQWDIFHQLSCELLAGENCVAARQGLQATVFIVGDPKQSIYGFRGAKAQIMHTATADLDKFKPRPHPLTVNYRSAAHLLKFFNAVFPALDLPDFHQHQPAKDAQQVHDYGTVTLALLSTTEVEKEAEYVACHIAQALRDKPHLQASDICILYRNGTHAEVFRAALSRAGLSSFRHEEQGFFKAQTSQDLLALCKWLALPQDQQALLTVLRSPLCAIPAQEVLHVYAQQQAQARAYCSSHILRALAVRYPQPIQALQDIRRLCNKTTPCRLLLYALHHLGALPRYRDHGGEFIGQQAQQNITRCIDLLAAAEREGCHTLAALHVRLTTQAQHDSIGSAVARADAVTLMTIHKAKGLQFKYVVLVQAQGKWAKRDSYWLKTDDSVIYSGKTNMRPQDGQLDALYATSDKDDAAESLRLLYVALTRAEHYLLVCGSTPKRGKGHGFLPRIVAAVKASDLSWQNGQADDDEIITLCGTADPPAVAATNTVPLPALSTARLHSDSLQQEVRILLPHQRRAVREAAPEKISPAARVYGIYLHKALEQQVKQAPPPTRSYWDKLAVELGDDRESMWHKAERTRQKLLAAPVWQNLWPDALWSKAEMPIVCLDDGLLINGVIDLLICYPQQRLQLIDYKTGARRDDLSAYRHQLATYCRAVHKLHPDHTITAALLFTDDCQLVPV